MTPKILVLDRSEELAEQARMVVSDMAPTPEVVSCTRVGSIAHVQEHEGPFSLMLAGPSLATHAGLRRLAALHKDSPGVPIMMAFSHRPDASLREIVQVGAVDLLDYPPDDTSLRGAIRRALDIAEHGRRPSTAMAGVSAEPAPGQKSARVFTVCSATGGCGKTFYSTNLALFLARFSGGRVALVDLDLQFGEITTALRLQPPYTIVDALGDDPDDEETELAQHIDEYLIPYEENFFVLPAPRDPAQADSVAPIEVTKILESLRGKFDYIVVDTPTALAETVLAAFDLSEHLFVMATLDLPSVRNLGMFLQTLDKLKIPSDNISLLLNKVETDIGVDVAQIRKLFPQGFRSTLPYAKEASRSINVGKPVIASYPQAEISQKMIEGMRELLPEDHLTIDIGEPEQSGGPLSRLFRRANAPTGGAKV